MLNKILILLLFGVLGGCSSLPPTYLKIGAGYKVNELRVYNEHSQMNDPLTARIELCVDLTSNVTIGYSHRSQWLNGWPFNNKSEYYADEFFVDYKIKLNQ